MLFANSVFSPNALIKTTIKYLPPKLSWLSVMSLLIGHSDRLNIHENKDYEVNNVMEMTGYQQWVT